MPHLLPVRRGLIATCYVRPAGDLRALARGRVRDGARRDGAAGGDRAGALARPGHRRRRDRRLHRPRDRHRDRRLRARQPRQGRGRPGRAEREPRARPRPRRPGCGSRGCSYERHRRQGLRRRRRPRRHPPKATKDLAVVRSTGPAVGAAMFTVNQVLAAPVVVSKAHLEVAEPQAIVVNSGVANAATGERGELDALATAAEAGRLLDLDAEEVLVLSTGVIGPLLPLDKVIDGPRSEAAGALSPDGGADAAEAILTTDTRPKQAAVSLDGFTVGGMAKGSGMIHPKLATMLAVVTTDYPLEPGEALDHLRPAVDRSFNSISVDGECSTNDAVCLLANGASGIERTPATDTRVRARARPRLRRPRPADRRGRRGRDRARRDRGHRRRRRRAGTRDRRADRHLAARQDRALRARRELGPRARRRRLGAVQRRLRARRHGAADARLQRRHRPRARHAAGRRAGRLERRLPDRARPRARRRPRRAT